MLSMGDLQDKKKVEVITVADFWPSFAGILPIIELDDGKILTGKPHQFDGKKPMGFRCRFSLKPIQ